ncbi:MAG TPA: thioredoxin domain-containing protein [Anaerolineales bacterium]|nr:thioredoxin domain-containing protein [Anaerolineales bacterium]
MNKKILVLLIGVSLLACNFLFPPKATSTPEPVVAPPTEDLIQPSDSQDPAPDGFTIVRLHPKDGDLQKMLAEEAQKASALGQMPIVEFDATWCPPCQAIDKGIKSRNELMLEAYRGTYIVKLDVDEWGWKDGKVQDFSFTGIPVYFKLDAEGHQTGDVIDGGAWGEDIPENIAPVMDKFFH